MSAWVSMRRELVNKVDFHHVSVELGVPTQPMFFALYKTACWFAQHGKYGKMKIDWPTLDRFVEIPGFAEVLHEVRWATSNEGVMCLHYFCNVSATRKSLGKKIRDQVLSGATCAFCGAIHDLCIDHIVPVVRGGSCEADNLQALCRLCNSRKGRKTMAEFISEAAQ